MAQPPERAPSAAQIERIAEEEFERIPRRFHAAVSDIVFRVEEFPDAETMREMALDTPFDILGLYRGVSLDRRSAMDTPQDVDIIFLYRRPMLDYWCETGEPLAGLVRHVLIHEIGHHLGFSDEDMEAIEDQGPAGQLGT